MGKTNEKESKVNRSLIVETLSSKDGDDSARTECNSSNCFRSNPLRP